jgi:predicted transcriptional regulator
MNILTLKIPEELDAALLAASRARGLSKSAIVRQALEQSLNLQVQQAGAAERWVAHWRGRLAATAPAARKAQVAKAVVPDERLAHLLAKHLR